MDVFFDEQSDYYDNRQPYRTDFSFIKFIKSQNNLNKTFLDIGGGSGFFSTLLKKDCPEIEITIIDPSLVMLKKICDDTILKYQGQLPNQLNIPSGKKFNYVLIKEVLHHVTGMSINESKNLVIESLKNTSDLIDETGYLMIHENYCESFLYPPITRILIFYLLKFQNIIHIKILPKEFLLGLDVCFYTRAELELFFQQFDLDIIESDDEIWGSRNFKKHLLFLKHWGRIFYVLKKRTRLMTKDLSVSSN